LASVPQHTGYVDALAYMNPEFGASNGSTPLTRETTSDDTSSVANHDPPNHSTVPKKSLIHWKDTSPLRLAGGYFLLWPLFMVGEMNLGTNEIRAWVIGRLRRIGDNMGIMLAHGLADVLSKKEEIRAWDIDDKHMRFEAVELLERKVKAARSQLQAELYAGNISNAIPEGKAWEFGAATNRCLKELNGPLPIPLHDLRPGFEATIMKEKDYESLLITHFDERYPCLFHQVRESQQTMMDEHFAFPETDFHHTFDLPMHG